ncbi:hypothetical protein [Streptomyces sp. NPDC001985]
MVRTLGAAVVGPGRAGSAVVRRAAPDAVLPMAAVVPEVAQIL